MKAFQKNKTDAANLEARFDAGEDVSDYFDLSRAKLSHGGVRPGAGRKPTGKQRKVIKITPDAIERFQAFAKRRNLASFSAAVEEASLMVQK